MIARKQKRAYCVVYFDEAAALGDSAAFLLSALRFFSKTRKKDDHGYFTIEGEFLRKALGFKKDKFIQARKKLIDAKRIDYIQGRNQNVKSRYKLVL